jgi:hypothetical protein
MANGQLPMVNGQWSTKIIRHEGTKGVRKRAILCVLRVFVVQKSVPFPI